MLRKPCSKCGTTDYPKYRRKLKSRGKYYDVIASYCVRCNREEDSLRRTKEQRTEQHRRWAEKNKEHLKAYYKKYRSTEKYLRRRREQYHQSKINNIKGSNI